MACGISDKFKLTPGYSVTETRYNSESLHEASLTITLYSEWKQRRLLDCVDAHDRLCLCFLLAAKSGFLASRPIGATSPENIL